MQSLHRYSSDLCVFFVLVHFLRVLFEGRFVGARWLAWVTGVLSVGILEVVGWSGYWLVWDARGQHVATGTARLLDMLPIVVDPMGRSLLFNEAVNSLLFFAVFFVHMLVPIALAIVLWLHLARVSRAQFLTRAPMTVWTLGVLLLLSVAFPAQVGPPADLTALGQTFSMDWWYLMPLVLTDRLSGGALWALALVVGPALASFPLWMARGRPEPAEVDVARCNECMQCYQDCPFEAISMIPRTEENPRYALEANVDPSRCVGCGICSGSCDSTGVLPRARSAREGRGLAGGGQGRGRRARHRLLVRELGRRHALGRLRDRALCRSAGLPRPRGALRRVAEPAHNRARPAPWRGPRRDHQLRCRVSLPGRTGLARDAARRPAQSVPSHEVREPGRHPRAAVRSHPRGGAQAHRERPARRRIPGP
jgi:ferredoxin